MGTLKSGLFIQWHVPCPSDLKVDRKAFSVGSLTELSDEKAYWFARTLLNVFDRWKSSEGSIMDIELPFDFKEFLKLLNENDVRHLLIRGYAVGYHGYPRATNDMDTWIAIHPDNAQRDVSALKDFGFDHPELTPERFLQKNKFIRMGHPLMRLEISTGISGVEFEDGYASQIVDELDGVTINIIDLPHLKANKKAASQLKDLADLENLP
jgi:hypothetical protein